MKKVKKAVGYVCDIPVAGTDVVITREEQVARMKAWAARENVELVKVYEDTDYTDDFANRPGVKAVLDCREPHDAVVVERVWSLSRKRVDLEPFLAELDKRDVRLTASSYLWDCVSQQVRHRYTGNMCDKMKAEALAQVVAKAGRYAA